MDEDSDVGKDRKEIMDEDKVSTPACPRDRGIPRGHILTPQAWKGP